MNILRKCALKLKTRNANNDPIVYLWFIHFFRTKKIKNMSMHCKKKTKKKTKKKQTKRIKFTIKN